jgi:uncharacterized protein
MRKMPWVGVSVGTGVAALVGGRWLALNTTDRLWAESLGVGGPHADVAMLRLAIGAATVLVASVWFTGNLLLVYRQIGAVQVPRRVGDLEIVEHVPRRYLLIGALAIGVLLGIVTSYGTGDWWLLRALDGVDIGVGAPDPVLGLPTGYYLFRLPWLRAIQSFALLLTAVGFMLLALLYSAIRAVRREDRQLVLVPFARWHLAVLLGTIAIALSWGYALEPAELVAGLHGVPYDTILVDVRIPVARGLATLALLVGASSLLWLRIDRVSIPITAWATLLGASFVGHILLPGIVASARGPEGRAAPDLAAAAGRARSEAFRMAAESVAVPLAIPDEGFATRHHDDLERIPIWDSFVLTAVLNRTARAMAPSPRSGDRFFDASLMVEIPPGAGRATPVFLAVREPDSLALAAARGTPWAARHGDPYAYAAGAVAVQAERTGAGGSPLFIPRLDRPDSTTSYPADVALDSREVWFGPGMPDFAVAGPESAPLGVVVSGWWRRVALAWALQSPAFLSRQRVPAKSVVVVERAVASRLARCAPMARFGAAYPVVADRRLVWLSPGYVAEEGYPLSSPVVWRGRRVRYLQVGLIGTVDAATGATAVYLTPDADPVSQAWARLVPGLIRPAEALPAALAIHVRYAEELFGAQLQLLRDRPGRARAAEPQWRVGPAVGDPTVRLRLQAVDEVQLDARVAGVVEGSVVRGRPRLRVLRYPEPYALAGPSELESGFRNAAPAGAPIGGAVRLVPFADGAVSVQAFYADSGTLAGVVAGWRGMVGRGANAAEALQHLQAQGSGSPAPVAGTPFEAAREWFQRLDRARADGDWRAFGDAWAGLRAALGLDREPTPSRVAPPFRRD